jgi:hypothetical protein
MRSTTRRPAHSCSLIHSPLSPSNRTAALKNTTPFPHKIRDGNTFAKCAFISPTEHSKLDPCGFTKASATRVPSPGERDPPLSTGKPPSGNRNA